MQMNFGILMMKYLIASKNVHCGLWYQRQRHKGPATGRVCRQPYLLSDIGQKAFFSDLKHLHFIPCPPIQREWKNGLSNSGMSLNRSSTLTAPHINIDYPHLKEISIHWWVPSSSRHNLPQKTSICRPKNVQVKYALMQESTAYVPNISLTSLPPVP